MYWQGRLVDCDCEQSYLKIIHQAIPEFRDIKLTQIKMFKW